MNYTTQCIYCEYVRLCSNRVVEKHVLRCGSKALETWAKNWLDGTDRTVETAERVQNIDVVVQGHRGFAPYHAVATAIWAAKAWKRVNRLTINTSQVVAAIELMSHAAVETADVAGGKDVTNSFMVIERAWQVKTLIDLIVKGIECKK